MKNKNFLITESLTATCVSLLKDTQGKYGVRNVWIIDGCFLYKEKKYSISLQKIRSLSVIKVLWKKIVLGLMIYFVISSYSLESWVTILGF